MFRFKLRKRPEVFLALLLLLASAPALAADFTVGAGTACALADAIRAANSDSAVGGCPAGRGHDAISLASDIDLNDKLPAISSHLSIDGNGHRISAGTRHRILKVKDGGVLELRNVTLHQGYTSRAPGAALYIEYGKANLVNVKIVDNLNESGYGGAVGIRSGTLTCLGCTFQSNLGVTGGALWVGGDAYATIDNSRFEDNHAQQGGAIFVDGGGLVFNSSKAYRNDAGYGGGIFSKDGTIRLQSHSEFTGNFASAHGGGLYADGGLVIIADTSMRDNQAVRGRHIYAAADLYIFRPTDISRDGIYHVR